MAVAKKGKQNGSSVQYGREVLRLGAEAISSLQGLLNSQFDKAVELLLTLSPEGRLIVSGMGKAGFIAMKVSATFASTGIPSFFLHPAEAIHGDLGRFSKSDIVLILSNSGETPEILTMLGSVKRMGCPVISMTASTDCSLAKHSDVILSIGKIEEAGPLGLAPTTSTTVMLALADALAMATLSCQDFTKEQFALYHPGGSLGRQLMVVSEIMRSGEELAVAPKTMTTREVLHVITITKGRPGAAAVVDGEGKLCGVYTDGDLRRCLERNESFLNLPIEQVMGKNPKTIYSNALAQEALHLMSEHKIDQLIVVDDGHKPIGLIDVQDLMDIKL